MTLLLRSRWYTGRRAHQKVRRTSVHDAGGNPDAAMVHVAPQGAPIFVDAPSAGDEPVLVEDDGGHPVDALVHCLVVEIDDEVARGRARKGVGEAPRVQADALRQLEDHVVSSDVDAVIKGRLPHGAEEAILPLGAPDDP